MPGEATAYGAYSPEWRWHFFERRFCRGLEVSRRSPVSQGETPWHGGTSWCCHHDGQDFEDSQLRASSIQVQARASMSLQGRTSPMQDVWGIRFVCRCRGMMQGVAVQNINS